MTKLLLVINFIFALLLSSPSWAQHADSTIDNLQKIPTKYINGIDRKIKQYSSRITSKTEKTLTKLSRWENKIQVLLQKVNPEAADRLFGNNQATFTSLLQKIKEGESLALQYQAPYNKYRDDVTTSLQYLAQQKEQFDSGLIKKVKVTSSKMKELATEEDNTEALQQFIKERKNQLVQQAFQYIGKSKYLTKINKEAYYYAETLKNYKELFADSKKGEETARTILSKIPAFQKFMQKNSLLAGLFGQPSSQISPSGNVGSLAGLQTRASVQSLIQDRIASGGPNTMQQVRQNIQAAQGELTKLKDKLLNTSLGNGGGAGMPDFKPNQQKTKTFLQRVETSITLQTEKGNNYLPSSSSIGLSIGYKLNDKSLVGMGAAYRVGLGSGLNDIRLSHQGIGLRTFIDYKLKGKLYISGGYEQNYNNNFRNISQLKDLSAWQQSALLGVSKKIQLKGKKAKVQLLYDFFNYRNRPVSHPFIYRIEYNLK